MAGPRSHRGLTSFAPLRLCVKKMERVALRINVGSSKHIQRNERIAFFKGFRICGQLNCHKPPCSRFLATYSDHDPATSLTEVPIPDQLPHFGPPPHYPN